MATPFDEVKGVGRPAREALTEAGYPYLEALDRVDFNELLAIHGVGRRGLERLQAALVERGWSMHNAPKPEVRDATWSEGHTGKNTDDRVGALNDQSPVDYLNSLDTERRKRHGHQLFDLFNRVTDAEPLMWGDSVVGYGALHYRYATGREGDTFKVGFSPRKAKISLYGLPHDDDLMNRLGKFTTGVSCIYLNKPEDVDLDVLEELIRRGWEADPAE